MKNKALIEQMARETERSIKETRNVLKGLKNSNKSKTFILKTKKTEKQMRLHKDATNPRVIKRFKTLEDDLNKVHNNRYDYSKSVYINSNEKITIICKEHGEFEQRVSEHLKGKGCPECAIKNSRSTTEEFIKKAIVVHGDIYDYSKVNYKTGKDNVTIICPIHGEFPQRPDHHLSGKGCKQCNYKIPTTEEFILRAKEIHGDKYCYDDTIYVNRDTPVIIECPEHGKFQQRAADHYRFGCSQCAGNIKKSTEQFIEEAKEIHGDKYDYSKVKYTSNDKHVIIRCPIHGDFIQTPTTHLRGCGCNKCSNNIRTPQEFITKAREVHGDKYDYSLTNFVDSRERVTITCKEHGEFQQKAGDHLIGKGCPGCAISGYDQTKPGILYYLKVNDGLAYKIGITNKSVQKRYSKEELSRIEVIQSWKFEDGSVAYEREQNIKKVYAHARYKGEDLLKDGNTELFNYDVLKLDKHSVKESEDFNKK